MMLLQKSEAPRAGGAVADNSHSGDSTRSMNPAQGLIKTPTRRAAWPIWPNPANLEGRLLARLLRQGFAITAKEWLAEVRALRLAAQIHSLSKTGWKIESETLSAATNDCGRTAQISRHWLNEDQRQSAAASASGAEFIAAVNQIEASRRPLNLEGQR